MKNIEFAIDANQAKWAFSPIRTKQDVIILWMNAIKTALSYEPVKKLDAVGEMTIHVAKMSRLFFSSPDKVFSVSFPFMVTETPALEFSTHSCESVDSWVTSEVIGLINSHQVLKLGGIWEFVDPVEASCSTDPNIWAFLRDLMLSEDGYIRFDHDPKNQNGSRHPLYHVDVFYSSAPTFKLGTVKRLSQSDLKDMLDITTDCLFLK